MARLIDADAFIKKHWGTERGFRFISPNAVEIEPTVEEREKSRWTALNQRGFFAKEYKCEMCENVVDMGCYTRGCDYDYCPYCGAEMEDNDE